jgi:hypothetical protein
MKKSMKDDMKSKDVTSKAVERYKGKKPVRTK